VLTNQASKKIPAVIWKVFFNVTVKRD
jgi:hypothetical protein